VQQQRLASPQIAHCNQKACQQHNNQRVDGFDGVVVLSLCDEKYSILSMIHVDNDDDDDEKLMIMFVVVCITLLTAQLF